MPLPKPENLAQEILLLERRLTEVERGFADHPVAIASPDDTIHVIARGDIRLEAVTINPAAFLALGPFPDAGVLKNFTDQMHGACALALNGAIGVSSSLASEPARTYGLTGLPGPDEPPPRDNGFDVLAGHLVAAAPGIFDLIGRKKFEARSGNVTALVHGSLELCRLTIASPLPASTVELERDVILAVNEAIAKAKGIFDEVAAVPIADAAAAIPQPRLADARCSALLVVEKASALRASDELLRARLAALGFVVELRPAPDAVVADAFGRGLIVISESINASDLGGKFAGAEVPLIVCEPESLRDLKMTGTYSGTDFGSITNQKELQITAGHPLAAGLGGRVQVASSGSTFTFGKPGSAADKLGGIVGKSGAYGIFAYDTGHAMVGLNAPARRVGFFPGKDTPAKLTAEGWKLFDAAVRWATAAKAVLTVNSTALAEGDAALKRRLEEVHGLEVLVRLDDDTKTADLKELKVHVISESVSSSKVGTRFKSSPAPTIVCEALLLDDMRLTGTTQGVDYGVVAGQSDLDIAAETPLTGCAAGKTSVVFAPRDFAWGRPGPDALRIAALVDGSGRSGVFAYDSGAPMVGLRAPAPRIGFFATAGAPAVFTPAGAALFDEAVRWARRPRALLVVGNAANLGPADQVLRKRLEESFGFVVEVRTAEAGCGERAPGKQVVVLSESVNSGDVGDQFTSAAAPVVCLEPLLYDNLKMTGTKSGTDFGTAAGQTEIEIVLASHPLAAGLPVGKAQAAGPPANFGWGKPAAAALKVARIVGKTDQWAIFGYEKGVAMVGATAPARRVGFFAAKDTAAALNENGLRLFDAAVLWAAGNIEVRSLPGAIAAAIPIVPVPGVIPIPTPKTPWKVGVAYKVGDEVSFNGLDYRCRQAHTSQSDWTPPATYALWERINAGSVWAPQVIYKTGDVVTYMGQSYRCIQGHQAVPGWEPPNVPALWQAI